MNPQRKRITIYAVVGGLGAFLLLWTALGRMESPFSGEGASLWTAGLLTCFILSFLYQDNPFYRFAEALFIGVSAAYLLVQAVWEQIIKQLLTKLWPELVSGLIEGELEPVDVGTRIGYFVTFFLGLLLLARLSRTIGWVSRWPIAIIVGWTAGTNLVVYLVSNFANQMKPSLISLVALTETGDFDIILTLSQIVLVLGLLCALIYFFFSVEHKGALGVASKAGIFILMITFGAAFGYTVAGRITLLISRMEFLLMTWTQIIRT